jgi:hypothetical protein
VCHPPSSAPFRITEGPFSPSSFSVKPITSNQVNLIYNYGTESPLRFSKSSGFKFGVQIWSVLSFPKLPGSKVKTLFLRALKDIGCAITQAFRRRLSLHLATQVGQGSSCGICGERSGTGAGFLWVLQFILAVFIPQYV